MCEAQCASLRSRLERRVNRVPATKRQLPLVELLAPPPPPQSKPAPAPVKAAPAKKVPTKKAPAVAPAPALAPAPKTRAAPAATTSRPGTAKGAPKATTKPIAKHAASKSVPTTSMRGKKRSSDEAASEDKENVSVDLAVPKKRARAATTTTKQSAVPKPTAPAARSTRAASRKTAPADVLSPKNNNSRTKPSTRSVRPR